MTRRINDAGLALVKLWEEFRSRPYLDTGRVPTIGYGHTRGVTMSAPPCSVEQALVWLRGDLSISEGDVERRITVPLNDNQFAALVSFDFNTGAIGSNNGHTNMPWTIVRRLNNGEYDWVPYEMAHQDSDGTWRGWVHDDGRVIDGLINRRLAEIELWNTPIS